MDVVPKSTLKKRHYCSVCSNFRGKIVDGQPIVLHRLPADTFLRKLWIKRLKTVMKNFRLTATFRVCSAHFEKGRMSTGNDIPSIFQIRSRRKLFGTKSASLAPDQCDSIKTQVTQDVVGATNEWKDGDTIDSSACINCAAEVTENNDNFEMEEGDCYVATKLEMCHPLRTNADTAEENVSVVMHDYCGHIELENINTFQIGMCTKMQQTDVCHELMKKHMVESSTQTYTKMKSSMTETEATHTKIRSDKGIQCHMPDISFYDIEKHDAKVMLYTGLPNAGTFYALFDEMDDSDTHTARCGTGEKKGRPRKLPRIDEFFLVLIRLRLGLLIEDLAQRFTVSKSTCSTIISLWIDYLYIKLAPLCTWPCREVIDKTMPRKFKEKYPRTRVIVDCTEFFTQTPQSLINKSLLYSHYKSHMTYKALLGISPSGLITFVSDLWSGAISDKQITRSCGILDLCKQGDAIMADKGFLIADLTTPRGIHLIIPPLKMKRFTRRQVEETRRIANLRIYVEMAMERVKNFRILQGVIPISMAGNLSKTLKICAGLSNMQAPLVLDD